jgi:signal transduction histidine kinase
LRSDLGRSPLRLVTGAVVIAAGVIEVQSLGRALESQALQRERAVAALESEFGGARQEISAFLSTGAAPWHGALDRALRAVSAAEAEVFAADGRRLAEYPAAAAVAHWPRPSDVSRLQGGRVLVVGPVASAEPRLLLYAGMRAGPDNVVLRLAVPSPELVDAIRAQRHLLLGHAATLLALLLAGVMAVLPVRDMAASAPPRVLDAYHAALERLRDQGQAQVRRHQSERQRMEEEMRDRDAMVRAGELTAGMVHEVRNGLNTILGYARLAEQEGSPAAARDAAARIRQECEGLVTLIRRFMDFIKREALNLTTFSVSRMLARVAARESAAPDAARIVLRDGADVDLVADEDLLERAFENLVRNARQAAGPGGHVWIDWRLDRDRLAVVVADDGPGMPASVRGTLRPFFTTKAGGLGLGIATALKIVRLHGGELLLADRPPRGLVATVRLPLVATAQALPTVTEGPSAAASPR